MNLYSITLPYQDNAGNDCMAARRAWETLALINAGGFTAMPACRGVWRDPKTEVVYSGPMGAYQIACSVAMFDLLLRKAFDLFPDQVAIFTALIGQANIVSRSSYGI